MKKQTLAFDIDGVIVDWCGSFLRFVNTELGTNMAYDECKYHDLSKCFNLSVELMKKLRVKYDASTNVGNLTYIDGAKQSMKKLAKYYQLAIITSRQADLEEDTDRWLDLNFPNVSRYYSMGRKNPFAGAEGRKFKPQIAEEIGAVCLVEDNEEEFHHWDSRHVEPICFPQPWNELLLQTHPHISRLNWSQILERFIG